VCRIPQAALWDSLSDYNNVAKMGAASASARLVEGNPKHYDCVYEAEIIWQGSASNFTARMIDANPPGTLTWDAVTGVGRSRLRFDLEPIDPATTFVTVTLSYEASSRAHTLETLTWGFLSGTLQRTLAELSQLSPDDTSTS